MFQKKYFEDFPIAQLLQKVWDNTYALEHNGKAKYFVWLPLCKQRCMEFLREKWIPSYLHSLKFVVKRVEKQHSLYYPENYVDHENSWNFWFVSKRLEKKFGCAYVLSMGYELVLILWFLILIV